MMTRLVAAVSSLAMLASFLIIAGQAIPGTAAQTETTLADHPLVGSWLVYETNPPNGGPPVLSGVASFFDDGNALLSGFGDQRYQGTWIIDSSHEATFTVVAPSAGEFGEIDQIRGTVEVATDGGPFRGTYSFDVVRADDTSTFNYNGPIEGRRVEAQAPNPYP
jgi:hypothetical protein